MSDDVAYRLSKAFNESVGQGPQSPRRGSRPTPWRHGVTGCGVPLHPGAIKYYKEKGILK